MNVFRPKWKHSDWRVRLAAVQKLTDQPLLADIAKNAVEQIVRTTAALKLTDQAVLAEIAKNDFDPLVRAAAAERLRALGRK